jgi:ribose/xylose/arabinose/galactoside ABC-type transport system permease subunit
VVQRQGVKGLLRFSAGKTNYGLFIALFFLLFVAFLANVIWKVNFFKLSNLFNVTRSFSILGVVSLGQTMVIISGGLDLSVGSAISTSDVVAASIMNGIDMRVLPVILLCIVMGGLIGLFNGYLVTKRGVPPFIATLGTSIILRGARLIYTKGSPKGNIPVTFRFIGIGSVYKIPAIFILFVAVAVLFSIVLNKTLYGRKLYVTGSNPTASKLCGVNTDWVTIMAYVSCSTTAALGGLLLAAYTNTADNWVGQGYDLDSIAAVVLGGAAIGGGIGSVSGTIVGAMIMIILVNLSLLANLPIQSQMLVKGVVVIGAVWINSKKIQWKTEA